MLRRRILAGMLSGIKPNTKVGDAALLHNRRFTQDMPLAAYGSL